MKYKQSKRVVSRLYLKHIQAAMTAADTIWYTATVETTMIDMSDAGTYLMPIDEVLTNPEINVANLLSDSE